MANIMELMANMDMNQKKRNKKEEMKGSESKNKCFGFQAFSIQEK